MTHQTDRSSFVAILLAAGRGRRFDASGERSKLLASLADGAPVVTCAADNLLEVVPRVVAVVRSGDTVTERVLAAAGCEVVFCDDAEEGMGASLRRGVAATADAPGWIVALGDMPRVRPATIQALLEAMTAGADIAAPCFAGRRGNPVAFSGAHRERLCQLQGDKGARDLLRAYPVTAVAVEDPGILFDIDTASDLETALSEITK